MKLARAAIALVLSLATAIGAYAGSWVFAAGSLEGIARRGVARSQTTVERWVSRDGNEVRFATLEGTPTPAPWTTRPGRYPIPATAHEVPLLEPTRTPLVPDGFNRFTAEGRGKYLNAIRGVFQRAGYGDIDARIAFIVYAQESGWDRSCYGNNCGNVKSQGTVYARSFADLSTRLKAYVTVPESVGVQIFADRFVSIDGYHVFASPEDYARYWVRIISTYPGALAAIRQGGLQGAITFGRAIESRGYGYSPKTPEQSAAFFESVYKANERLLGARWQR